MNISLQKPAIIVRLMGGLGNQLFQYAFGRRLAMLNNAALYLDASGYASNSGADPVRGVRVCELKHFNIAGQVLDEAPGARRGESSVTRRLRKLIDRVRQIADSFRPYYARHEIREPARNRFSYDPYALNARVRQVVSVRGFWQTSRYFEAIEDDIRRDLTFRNPPAECNASLAARISAVNSVAIHVRHGDNANEVAPALGVLPVTYFSRAMESIRAEIPEPQFFVFSDSIEWTRGFLGDGTMLTFVDHNEPSRSHEDLRLMTLCKHHILSNSTFGWWGAWMAKNQGQIVYAPRRYYQNIDQPNPDLYPAEWRLLEA